MGAVRIEICDRQRANLRSLLMKSPTVQPSFGLPVDKDHEDNDEPDEDDGNSSDALPASSNTSTEDLSLTQYFPSSSLHVSSLTDSAPAKKATDSRFRPTL